MTTATAYARRNQNLYRSKAQLQLGPVSVGFIMIAAISVLALLYLTQITKTSVFGYKASELSQKRQQMLMQKQDLEVEVARLQSIQQIQSSDAVSKMVPEGNVTYAGQ
jgi:hypothetical protein